MVWRSLFNISLPFFPIGSEAGLLDSLQTSYVSELPHSFWSDSNLLRFFVTATPLEFSSLPPPKYVGVRTFAFFRSVKDSFCWMRFRALKQCWNILAWNWSNNIFIKKMKLFQLYQSLFALFGVHSVQSNENYFYNSKILIVYFYYWLNVIFNCLSLFCKANSFREYNDII